MKLSRTWRNTLLLGLAFGATYLVILMVCSALAINPGIGEGNYMDSNSNRYQLGIFIEDYLSGPVSAPLLLLIPLTVALHTNVISWWLIIPYIMVLGILLALLIRLITPRRHRFNSRR